MGVKYLWACGKKCPPLHKGICFFHSTQNLSSLEVEIFDTHGPNSAG